MSSERSVKHVSGPTKNWRRRRDSNPRDPYGSNGFQDRRFQPLTHSSALIINDLVYLLLHICCPFGNGQQVSVKLAYCNDEYRTLKNVRPLGEQYLQSANSGQRADAHLTLQQYAETVYLPHARKSLKPSTYKGCFNLYTKHIQPCVGGLRLATCATHNVQRVLWNISQQEELSHQSFLNINSVLSAIFTHARRTGTLRGPNPTDGVEENSRARRRTVRSS